MATSTSCKILSISLLHFFWVAVLSVDAFADSAAVIDTRVNESLQRFYSEVKTGKEIAQKANGILVFPSIIKAGFGIGGEYGEGALKIRGKTVDYYSTAAASIGFQLGVQSKAVIILFMTQKALSDFRKSDGWEVGVDGSVVLVKIGAGGALDTTTLNHPIIGFILTNKGLMYNLTLEGSKMSRIKK